MSEDEKEDEEKKDDPMFKLGKKLGDKAEDFGRWLVDF